MIEKLKTVRGLVPGPVAGRTVFSIAGSCLVAVLDMLGVAAVLPLMQIVTGASSGTAGTAGAGWAARLVGSAEPAVLIPTMASLIAGAFVLKSLVTIGFRWWQLGFTTRLESEASVELMRRYVQSPYGKHRLRNVGEISRCLESFVPQTFSQVVQGLLNWITDAITLLALVVVLLFISPLATLLAAVVFAGSGWAVQRALRPRFGRVGETMARVDLDSWSALMPALNGFREVRLAGAAELFLARLARAKRERAHAQRELSLISELPKYVLEVAFVLGIGAVAALLFATQTPGEAASAIGVFAVAATRILPTVNRLIATTGLIRSGEKALVVLAAEVRELDRTDRHPSAPPGREYDGDIRLESVTFAFPDADAPVISSVSTTIEHGRTTAFVGASGAGKSTLLDLVLGLLAPTSGLITCGGVDTRADLNAWYKGLGVVPQEVFLLDDTLEANITLGARHTDSQLLDEAVRLAQLGPVIADLPEGLGTRLGERGVRLSGGQRQRVGIARALYRRPKVLVLDEATSALDGATEYRITETVERLSGTMTVIVVAHRLSTVRHADKIVFLSSGSVTAQGTFEEVRALSPEFSELVSLGQV
ncbi:ABC transporter ATP-binding protein [Sinomonas susongensis]|uniref:ABC transporter ATP-binding protein n=1 Tax=Sinomonas susongensis TaxID=1324851 RepID=UPI001485CA0D|nr:ABC transporter ATP-binding protein [Sinomonas susongensis]